MFAVMAVTANVTAGKIISFCFLKGVTAVMSVTALPLYV
jgi:hypothetical protein